MKAQFELKKSKNGEPFFALMNGADMVGRSEMYKASASAKNGVKSVQTNSVKAEILGKGQEGKNPKFQLLVDSTKKVRFHLTAGNGEIILQSNVFADEATARKEIAWVKKNAPSAKLHVEAPAKKAAPAKAAPAKKPAAKKPVAKMAAAKK